MSSYTGSVRRSENGSSTTTYTVPSSIRHTYESDEMTSTIPLAGFSPPSKGFFSPSSSVPTSRSDNLTATTTAPSMVPGRGRRRESITGQMRRKASETAAAAGGGGASGLSMTRGAMPGSPTGQAIPRGTRSPLMGAADLSGLSTSFGAAAEALSLSSSMTSNTTIGANPHSLSNCNGTNKEVRSLGHTHFGKECYGPSSTDIVNGPPASLLSSSAGVLDGSRGRDRRNSVSSSGTVYEDDDSKGMSINGSHQLLHKCESCAKVYRHPSCLVKHRWEHTVYWKEASKFLMSKHQQVQLLEAAAILVGMDSNARSLPEEKALWPAAVSPPSSGLLGSDQINFDTLMAAKRRHATATPSPARGQTPGLIPNDSSDGSVSSHYDPLLRSGTLSPLNGLQQLRRFGLDDGETHTSGSDGADRSGSQDIEDEDEEKDEQQDEGEERYGMDAGGDVMAEMEMDDVA